MPIALKNNLNSFEQMTSKDVIYLQMKQMYSRIHNFMIIHLQTGSKNLVFYIHTDLSLKRGQNGGCRYTRQR